MNSNNDYSLPVLSALLNEFYSASLNEERRRTIQKTLFSLELEPCAWRICLQHLLSTSDQYVGLYCLGIVEKFIITHWDSLSDSEKSYVRQGLQQYLFRQLTINDPNFLLKKAAKNLAHIACLDWPHMQGDFLQDAIMFLQHHIDSHNVSGIIVALWILQTSLEQLWHPHELISPTIKAQLEKYLLEHSHSIQTILLRSVAVLFGPDLLDTTTSNLNVFLSADHDPRASNVWQAVNEFYNNVMNELLRGDKLRYMSLSAWLKCACECIKVFHFGQSFLNDFYSIFYIFSLLGSPSICHANTLTSPDAQTSSLAKHFIQLGIATLDCFQEIVEKKNLSSNEMMDNLRYIFPLVECQLNLLNLNEYSQSSHPISSQTFAPHAVATLPKVDIECSEYHSKLIEILRFLMSNLFHNFVNIAPNGRHTFNPVSFLRALHNFTFSSLNADNYSSCLHMWSSYFDYIQLLVSSWPNTSPLFDILADFGKSLFSRIFYRDAPILMNNLDEVSNCDIENFQDIMQAPVQDAVFTLVEHTTDRSHELCEYHHYVKESLVTLNSLIPLVPRSLIICILNRYCKNYNDYFIFINSSGLLQSGSLNLPQDVRSIHWVLRDYAAALQATGYLLEHSYLINDPSLRSELPLTGIDLIKSLVDTLRTGTHIFSNTLPKLDKRLQSDLTMVILQNVLVLELLFLGNYVALESENMHQNRFAISRSHLLPIICEFLYFSESTIFTSASVHVPRAVKLCASRLFKLVLTHSMCKSLLSETLIRSSAESDDMVNYTKRFFNRFMETLCHTNQYFEPSVFRVIVCAFFNFFASELTLNGDSTSPENSLLSQMINRVFLPHLNAAEIVSYPESHLQFLGILNDSVMDLCCASFATRSFLRSVLQSSGIFDLVVQCITLVIDSLSQKDASATLRFCTAYLTFMCTLISVFSHSDLAISLVPTLLSRLLTVLNSWSSGHFPVPLIDCLLDIFLTLSKNRRLLISLADSILDLCCGRLLGNLGSVPSQYNCDQVDHLVCDACQCNPSSVQKMYQLFFIYLLDGFSHFFATKNAKDGPSNRESFTPVADRYVLIKADQFNRVIRILCAVFLEQQLNTELIVFVLKKFHALYTLRKFYDLPGFNDLWLPEVMRRLLNLLLNKLHASQRDSIIEALYHLMVCSSLPKGSSHSIANSRSHGINFFKQEFLPAYLSQLDFVQPTDHAHLISSFYFKSNDDSVCTGDFFPAVEQFANALHHLRTIRSGVFQLEL